MRKLVVALLIILCSFAAKAQQVIKSDDLGAFSQVELSGRMYVEMVASDVNKVEIELIETPTTKLKWSVSSGRLSIALNTLLNPKGSAKVKIFYKEISEIEVSSCEVVFKDIFSSDMIMITLSSAAKFTADCECDDMVIFSSGNVRATIGGITKYLSIRASELSNIEAVSLIASSVEVEAASGAEVYVTAKERLLAVAKSGSSVFYKGSPKLLREISKSTMWVSGSVLNIGK